MTAARVIHFTQHICSATKAACTINLGQTSSPSLNQGTASSSTASVYAGFLTGNSQVISSSSSNMDLERKCKRICIYIYIILNLYIICKCIICMYGCDDAHLNFIGTRFAARHEHWEVPHPQSEGS